VKDVGGRGGEAEDVELVSVREEGVLDLRSTVGLRPTSAQYLILEVVRWEGETSAGEEQFEKHIGQG
jgi:hypothetical protein